MENKVDKRMSTKEEKIEKEDTKLQCPHGRPVIVKLSKKEIEKWFKRIV